jgi:hypothetical protein
MYFGLPASLNNDPFEELPVDLMFAYFKGKFHHILNYL